VCTQPRAAIFALDVIDILTTSEIKRQTSEILSSRYAMRRPTMLRR
jgi:hypothetical protein